MPKFHWTKYTLNFKQPSGTSRGVLNTKESWFLIGSDPAFEYPAIGEVSIIEGLSPDPLHSIENALNLVVNRLNENADGTTDLDDYPAIQFGLEMLRADVACDGSKHLFQNSFSQGHALMPINGLVWMNTPKHMMQQVKNLVDRGFDCIKMKIGAIEFKDELTLIKSIRSEFGRGLNLRLDANGAFAPNNALAQLNALAAFDIHSIEQPIPIKHWEEMAALCEASPIPIALDEELINIKSEGKQLLLETIKPQFIIIKPSLLGGWKGSDEWITLAEKLKIGWWITSALESNIGLNAIAQYTYSKQVRLPQGLGTGSLYTNNIESPLYLQGQNIGYNPQLNWNLSAF
jgi:o-succinylbenzoate synthase